jgi:hypothetical protein
MKKLKINDKDDLEISKPTEEEIKQTIKLVKDKSDIDIPKSDAIKLAKLIKEMEWWMKTDNESGSPKQVTEKMTMEFKELIKSDYGKDITKDEAYNGARGLLLLVPIQEKQRIADEIRAILVTRRKVLRDPRVSEKTAKLLKLHYGIELNNNQIEQLIQYLSRKVWYEEGLDESLEKCLDDLLLYADKRNRGKLVNGIELHNEIRKAIDLAVNDLKLAGKEFEPLYREVD